MMMAGVVLLTGALALVTMAAYFMFQSMAPEPYMDEIFHVPQTQRYCAGQWREWDSKITTFPGLYFLGVVFGRAAHAVATVQGLQMEACSTAALRAVNAVFAVACAPLFYWLAKATDASRSEQQAVMLAAACSTFPLHYFFAFLYYTDVPSAFFTLAAHLAIKRRKGGLAAALAAAAVLMRQTNAVWVAFMAAEAVLDRCQPRKNAADGGSGKKDRVGSSGGGGSTGRGGTYGSVAAGGLLTLLGELWEIAQRAWVLKWELLHQLWGLAAVAASFATFVVWNGGVVVGDKAYHVPVRHLMQLPYFALYCAAWLAPVFWSPNALRAGWRAAACAGALRWGAWACACAVLAAVVRHFTLVHPFLLADNRHYTFYLWRKVVNRRWWVRYALVPLYALSLARLAGATQRQGAAWSALFAFCTCLVLVPAHLVEFRYFTVPFLVLVLNMRTPSCAQLAMLVAGYAAVNCVVATVYLVWPFVWVDGTIARFLW